VLAVNLTGRLRDGVRAEDVVLTLLTQPGITGRQTIGRVLLFTGSGLAELDIDERTTLCAMAVEAGATTAVVEPDAVTDAFLRRRGFLPYRAEPADDGATYAGAVDVDLATVEPMVSLEDLPATW
jgi:3-isopropylmalate/(R)-2-methylmalate dehydratase large subunit